MLHVALNCLVAGERMVVSAVFLQTQQSILRWIVDQFVYYLPDRPAAARGQVLVAWPWGEPLAELPAEVAP